MAATSRINKFIFQEGKAFLRLRTIAKDLKVLKDGENYKIEIPQGINAQTGVLIPVVGMKDFDRSQIKEDDDTEKVELSWGEIVKVRDAATESNQYFVVPNEGSFVVLIGPIPEKVERNKLELDWDNLQWGII